MKTFNNEGQRTDRRCSRGRSCGCEKNRNGARPAAVTKEPKREHGQRILSNCWCAQDYSYESWLLLSQVLRLEESKKKKWQLASLIDSVELVLYVNRLEFEKWSCCSNSKWWTHFCYIRLEIIVESTKKGSFYGVDRWRPSRYFSITFPSTIF